MIETIDHILIHTATPEKTLDESLKDTDEAFMKNGGEYHDRMIQ